VNTSKKYKPYPYNNRKHIHFNNKNILNPHIPCWLFPSIYLVSAGMAYCHVTFPKVGNLHENIKFIS
jgi:hypothetical protein